MGYSFNDWLSDMAPIGTGIQDVMKQQQQTTTGIFNGLFGTVSGVSKDISGTLSSLSMPLMLLGGGLLLLSVLKK